MGTRRVLLRRIVASLIAAVFAGDSGLVLATGDWDKDPAGAWFGVAIAVVAVGVGFGDALLDRFFPALFRLFYWLVRLTPLAIMLADLSHQNHWDVAKVLGEWPSFFALSVALGFAFGKHTTLDPERLRIHVVRSERLDWAALILALTVGAAISLALARLLGPGYAAP